MKNLIMPHGGKLKDLIDPARVKSLKTEALKLPSLTLNRRQLCDLELLLNGGFSPLDGFLGKKAYQGVLDNMRLPDGTLWPMPITLDISEKVAAPFKANDRIALRDPEGVLLAVMEISEIWKPDRLEEARKVFATSDPNHPGVDYLLNQSGDTYLGGKIEGVELPSHYDFKSLRQTPKELRQEFEAKGWNKIVAFQTRNPMHRAHFELTVRAAKQSGAKLLVHPTVGMTKPGDIDHFIRVRCYRKLMKRYPEGLASLSLLPLAMRMGGPREALWHAIIRKNYGCSHFIVGRDHAGPGKDKSGKDFYSPYAAQELVKKNANELEMTIETFSETVYLEDEGVYKPADEIPAGQKTLSLSGTDLRNRLEMGTAIPDWFTFPEIAEELKLAKRPRPERGFTVFFSGLSGSGKSTICNALQERLLEFEKRAITILDGDVVRTHLSSELGFTKEHRSLNIRRIGYVACQITKSGGIALCAPIAPYAADRIYNRQTISQHGGYIEVYVSTPIEVCEKRDRKGLYQKARQGLVKGFTGIDDPYEVPENPELTIDTNEMDAESAVEKILGFLTKEGYLRPALALVEGGGIAQQWEIKPKAAKRKKGS